MNNHDIRMPQYSIPIVQNVVGTSYLGTRLDLKTIAWKGRNCQYNPNRFAAVIMRLTNPKTTALVFSSGKIVVTGAKSQEDCHLASRKYARIIQKIGFKVVHSDFKIQNVVASSDVKFPIHLERLEHQNNNPNSTIQYVPQVFPGLVYRLRTPKMAFLIFVSGKIVVTGAKSYKTILDNFQQVYKLAYNYRKEQSRAIIQA